MITIVFSADDCAVRDFQVVGVSKIFKTDLVTPTDLFHIVLRHK